MQEKNEKKYTFIPENHHPKAVLQFCLPKSAQKSTKNLENVKNRVCPYVADASTPSGQSQLPTEVDNNVRE